MADVTDELITNRRSEEMAMRLLLDTRDSQRHTLLHFAAKTEYEQLARMLLYQGAEVDARDEYGATAPFLAAQSGREAPVWLSLEKGADVEAKNH
jgi:ankyrin repeat protein